MKKSFVDKVITTVAASSIAVLMSCASSAPIAEQPAAEQSAALQNAGEPAATEKPVPAENSQNLTSAEPSETQTVVPLDLTGSEPQSSSSDSAASSAETASTESSFDVPADSSQAVDDLSSVIAASNTAEPVVPAAPDTVVTKVSFFAIGDVLFHTPLFDACKKDESKCNFDHIFKNWKSDIESADFAAVNQETIFVSRESGYSSYPTFGTPSQVGDAEIAAGFDIVTHATNHTIDRGASNVDYTLDFWKSKGASAPIVLGIHGTAEDKNAIRYQEKNGIKFAFFNNTYGLNGQKMPENRQYLVDMQDDDDQWLKPITEADANADVVVVFMHVGTEYVPIPSDDAQKKVAKAIDAGADIVVCAHPHVVEPYGVLTTKKGNTGLVYWSLGNFISNQSKNPTLLGGVAKFVVQKTAVGENSSFAVTEASFEGSVTHWDNDGYTAIPLKDYSDKLAKAHAGKKADFKELKKLFQEAEEGYSKCGTEKTSAKLPMSVSRLADKNSK